jgi:cathepsin L
MSGFQGCKRIAVALVASATIVGGMIGWTPGVVARQAAPPGQPNVEQGVLDAGAPAEVKVLLTALRKRIQEKKHRFEVGFSRASRRKLRELAGTVPPPDLKQRIVQQSQKRALHLLNHPRVDAERNRVQASPDAPNPAMESFDWSQRGVVGSVKDQALCGDCWNFATVGVFESMFAIRNGPQNLLDLSEEQLLRCNTESPKGTCCGGWWAFDYIRDSGLVGEDHLPYTSGTISCDGGAPSASVPPCANVAGERYKAVAWDYVAGAEGVPSPDSIKKALCDHGPVICAVRVTDAFQNYKGGVFDEMASGDINHAVMIVGWTKDGWIVRNSWGGDWGANGYILIAYGSNSIGFGAAWVEVEPAIAP